MNEKNPSGWRFRLRTVFVVVTVICIWLGWQLSIVQHRRSLVREMRSNAAFDLVSAHELRRRGDRAGRKRNEIAWHRRVLGDVSIAQIVYSPYERGYSKEQLRQLEAAFSEATAVQNMPPEPCHPGCFPHGTPVETPTGPRAIESIRQGDLVLVVGPDGAVRNRAVESVFRTSNWLRRIDTDQGAFLTTETQPLCPSLEETVAAGKLQPGDTILAWRNGRPEPRRITGNTPTGHTRPVVNLVLGETQFFIAGGILARSKPPRTAESPGNESRPAESPLVTAR